MVKAKIKPILPSLREKKRYVAFEADFEGNLVPSDINFAVKKVMRDYVGSKGLVSAGIITITDKFNGRKGIIKVSNKSVDDLKMALMFIKNINGKDIAIKTLGVSGVLKKAYEKYVR